jgi:hypothetical protein
MNRKDLEKAAWRKTHKDFKSNWNKGEATILRFVPGVGTCSVAIKSLTDAELKEIAGIKEDNDT